MAESSVHDAHDALPNALPNVKAQGWISAALIDWRNIMPCLSNMTQSKIREAH